MSYRNDTWGIPHNSTTSKQIQRICWKIPPGYHHRDTEQEDWCLEHGLLHPLPYTKSNRGNANTDCPVRRQRLAGKGEDSSTEQLCRHFLNEMAWPVGSGSRKCHSKEVGLNSAWLWLLPSGRVGTELEEPGVSGPLGLRSTLH